MSRASSRRFLRVNHSNARRALARSTLLIPLQSLHSITISIIGPPTNSPTMQTALNFQASRCNSWFPNARVKGRRIPTPEPKRKEEDARSVQSRAGEADEITGA